MQYSYWSTESRRQEYWRTQTENHIQSELLWYHSARCSKSGKLYQAQVRMESKMCIGLELYSHIFVRGQLHSNLFLWLFLNMQIFEPCGFFDMRNKCSCI